MSNYNLDVRGMIAARGVTHTAVARQMGVSRNYFSLLLRWPLSDKNRGRILKALSEL